MDIATSSEFDSTSLGMVTHLTNPTTGNKTDCDITQKKRMSDVPFSKPTRGGCQTNRQVSTSKSHIIPIPPKNKPEHFMGAKLSSKSSVRPTDKQSIKNVSTREVKRHTTSALNQMKENGNIQGPYVLNTGELNNQKQKGNSAANTRRNHIPKTSQKVNLEDRESKIQFARTAKASGSGNTSGISNRPKKTDKKFFRLDSKTIKEIDAIDDANSNVSNVNEALNLKLHPNHPTRKALDEAVPMANLLLIRTEQLLNSRKCSTKANSKMPSR